jgi:hypothetical protein
MKKTLLLICFILFTLSIYSQTIKFEYDNSGNRVHRTFIPLEKSARDTSQLADSTIAEQLSKIEAQFKYEKLAEGQIKVFPNPTDGDLKIRLENISNTEGINMQLYSSTGSLLQSKMIDSDYSEFDMLSYSPGIYILRISRLDEKLEYKIIKK